MFFTRSKQHIKCSTNKKNRSIYEENHPPFFDTLIKKKYRIEIRRKKNTKESTDKLERERGRKKETKRRKEGRKEGRKKRKEGRKEGRKEETNGRKEERNERKEGRKEGERIGKKGGRNERANEEGKE